MPAHEADPYPHTDGAEQPLRRHAAALIDWAEAQFRELHRRDARDLAITLLAGVQGAAFLANTFGDVKILARETRRLDRWIDQLSAETVRSRAR